MYGKSALLLRVFTLLFLISLALFNFAFTVNAQDASFGIANYFPIKDKGVKGGSIVSFSSTGYFLSKTPYDAMMVGVVTDTPAISLQVEGVSGTYPVLSKGEAYVNVSGEGGAIKKGDPITSSSSPGVGMKADRSGYIIGSALEDFSSQNAKEVKEIAVSLNMRYFSSQKTSTSKAGIFDIFNLSAMATYEQPTVVLKYFIAGILVVFSCVLGFVSFGRIANTGIEALGRNPLAGRMIQIGIFFNVLITIAIILTGFVIAYFVLRL